jgi:hypothetical protein
MSHILLLFTVLTVNALQPTRIISKGSSWKIKHVKSTQNLFNSITQQPELTVSQLPLYEIKEILGKGSGVCAIRDISVGELIVEESPLFFIPSGELRMRLENEVEKLSEHDQERYYSLHGFVSHNDDESAIIEDLMAKNSNAKGSKSLKMRLPPIHIYQTNAYPCGREKSGIFPLLSRFNSHCIPNVHYNYNDKKGKSTMYCISSVKRGDEIVTCYTGLFLPKIERMRYLWGNFGFPCSCKSCTLTGLGS